MKTQNEMYTVAIGTHNAHGWIQWKGTDVCMDVHCKCGEHTHLDAEFAYYIKCPKCGSIYQVNPNVRLELVENPSEDIIDRAKLSGV